MNTLDCILVTLPIAYLFNTFLNESIRNYELNIQKKIVLNVSAPTLNAKSPFIIYLGGIWGLGV